VARAEVAEALTYSRDNFTMERGSRALALCGAAVDAERLLDELARNLPEATLTLHVARPLTTAMLALARGNPQQALTALDAIHPYDNVPSAELWPRYLRGQAYMQMKDGARAAAEFTTAIERRGTAPDAVIYGLAFLGRARAAALAGDPAARARYDEVFDVWKPADPDLKPVVEARREYAALK
jgi:hypothetical protein